MTEILIVLILLIIGYCSGTVIENNHFESLKKRERFCLRIPVTNTKNHEFKPGEVKEAKLIYGSAVISIDFFKKFVASLVNFLGGQMTTYESLVDRARREAILRMKENASFNTDMIINLKIETTSISKGSTNKDDSSVGSVEVFAYATAITLNDN